MVTLQTAENALKSFYLDAVKDTLDMKTSPLLAKIERSSENVYGKDVKKTVRLGINNAFGVSTETGSLPQSQQSDYGQMTATLKNLYGTIEISDKAIRASQSSEGAFVNLLNAEMESLLRSAKYHVGRMVMGNGMGYLADFHVAMKGDTVIVNSAAPIQLGMRVRLMSEDMELLEDGLVRTVTSISRFNNNVSLSGPTFQNLDLCGYICMANDDEELTGAAALYEKSTVYGLNDGFYDQIRPLEIIVSGDIDENKMQKMIDNLEESSGYAPDLIVCSWGVRRALLNYFKENGIRMDSVEIEGGFKALSFNGIPVVADRFCPPGMMYFFNTDNIKLYQLGDWQWMEGDDGKILHQVPGKPVYSATLVKYAELVFECPNSVGRIIGITEE